MIRKSSLVVVLFLLVAFSVSASPPEHRYWVAGFFSGISIKGESIYQNGLGRFQLLYGPVTCGLAAGLQFDYSGPGNPPAFCMDAACRWNIKPYSGKDWEGKQKYDTSFLEVGLHNLGGLGLRLDAGFLIGGSAVMELMGGVNLSAMYGPSVHLAAAVSYMWKNSVEL